MSKRLTGIVALGAATLFLGTVPAYAADTITSTTVVSAPATTTAYVEWSYVEWSYVEWSTTVAKPEMVLSRYVEW